LKTHEEASVGAAYEGVNESGVRNSPPEIGGVDATSKRSREASFDGADGVVRNGTHSLERIPKHFGNPDHQPHIHSQQCAQVRRQ
jgi:hypothetical protein